jgi:hypothetical protein
MTHFYITLDSMLHLQLRDEVLADTMYSKLPKEANTDLVSTSAFNLHLSAVLKRRCSVAASKK